MNNLIALRRAIAPLLDERSPIDATAVYYAHRHPDAKTSLVIYPEEATRAEGYIAFSRTGMDLFRPFMTMRLPIADMEACAALIHAALPSEAAVIARVPIAYYPLMQALFDIQSEEAMELYALEYGRFQRTINVMVTLEDSPNGLFRFVVRGAGSDAPVAASCGVNWQSPDFADVSVQVQPGYRQRGWGRSALSAMANQLLENGRTPLYHVAEQNHASIQLARSVGFTAVNAQFVLFQGVSKAAK